MRAHGSPVLLAAALAAALAGCAGAPRRTPATAPPAPADRPEARIDPFWSWWRDAAPRVAAAVDARRAEAIVDELSPRVAALDPRLAWETGPGLKGARRQLVLSAEGDPELRVLVERWRARAPPADAEWEYHPARQPSPRDAWPGMVLQADGVEIGFGDVRVAFETDDLRELVHVTCHHPAFATLEDVAARRAAFLVLGNVLGEDGVERWIGAIDASAAPLPDGEPLEALADAVSALAGRATGERYAVLEWRTDSDLPMLASANVAVKRIDHLLKDRHVEVVIPVRDPNASGLPTPEENAALNALEDELLAAVEDATTVWLGRETGEGLRITHLHATGDGGAEARARAWAAGHPDRRISVRTRPDPGWDVLDRWR